MRQRSAATLFIGFSLLFITATTQAMISQMSLLQGPCEFWVAPPPIGNDVNPGTEALPWATMEHAGIAIPDEGCTVWFRDGLYMGNNDMNERYTTQTTFRAIHPYQAILQHTGVTLEVNGGQNMRFEGFQFQHSNSITPTKHVVIVEQSNGQWAEYIVFANNIFHDSYNDDLLKIHNSSRYVRVENNIFYNQAASDQHIDVNSATDVIVQDNIFFNDFASSGRPNNHDTKHFVVVKDSNGSSDGLIGSRRVTIRRNVFLNWQGGEEALIQIGNDGEPYYEAITVLVENNLLIGNGSDLVYAVFGVKGVKDITFRNNTVVGDMPANAYGLNVSIAGANRLNQDIFFVNNIWSDPTGTMGTEDTNIPKFSNGAASSAMNLLLYNNLYWNGGEAIPNGNSLSPLLDDTNPLVANPLLPVHQNNVVLPLWQGTSFLSGSDSIREEFERLVQTYGRIPPLSPPVGAAAPNWSAVDDILGQLRGSESDLGAYETETVILDKHIFLALVAKN